MSIFDLVKHAGNSVGRRQKFRTFGGRHFPACSLNNGTIMCVELFGGNHGPIEKNKENLRQVTVLPKCYLGGWVGGEPLKTKSKLTR